MQLNLEKYDKLIWRANGTILLFACVGLLLVCVLAGYKLIKDAFVTHRAHDIVNVDQHTQQPEFLRLGYFESLKGTDFILIPLSSKQRHTTSSYSKSSFPRNYLLFNSVTKDSYWIWNSNTSVILQEIKIHDQIEAEKTQQIKALVFELVERDSNADGSLDNNDQKSIQYFEIASRKFIPVISQIDRSIGVQQTANDEILFFYSRAGKSFFKSLTVSSLKMSQEKEIGQSL